MWAFSPGRIDNGDSVGITIDIFNGSRPDLQPFLVEMTPYPPNGDWNQSVLFRYATVWQVLSSNTIVTGANQERWVRLLSGSRDSLLGLDPGRKNPRSGRRSIRVYIGDSDR